MLDDAGVLDGEGDLDDGERTDEFAGDDRRASGRAAGRGGNASPSTASIVGMVFWSGAVDDLHLAEMR